MEIKEIICMECSGDLSENGKTKNGRQKWICKKCYAGTTRENSPNKTTEMKLIVVILYLNGFNKHELSQLFGVSQTAIANWIKRYTNVQIDKPRQNRPEIIFPEDVTNLSGEKRQDIKN